MHVPCIVVAVGRKQPSHTGSVPCRSRSGLGAGSSYVIDGNLYAMTRPLFSPNQIAALRMLCTINHCGTRSKAYGLKAGFKKLHLV